MAVIQISRIQVRRGLADSPTPSGLPQLASGEIGWAIDDQRLWIGSGSVEEGAPAVENVEILTKAGFKEIIDSFTASNYTYNLENLNNGQPFYPVGAVSRTIQQKLDDTPVNITDFGVTFYNGDAVVDSGTLEGTINQAFASLYYEGGATPSLAPALGFPAGTYVLTSTIYVPPYAVIKGAGKGKTVFVMAAEDTAIFQTVGILPNNTIAGYSDFGDVDIDKQPQNISIEGITFMHDDTLAANNTAQMILLDHANNTVIKSCEFAGTYNTSTSISATNSGIELRYSLVNNVTIDDCSFSSLAVPIVSNYDINDIKITNSTFYEHAIGIQLGTTITGANDQVTGPTNVKIANNHFEYIAKSGIMVGELGSTVQSNVISSNNTFVDVGNNGTGDDNPVEPVVDFRSKGNQSINDIFNRFDEAQVGGVGYGASQQALVKGHATFSTRTPTVVSLTTSSSLQKLLVIPLDTSSNTTAVTDYVLATASSVRTGKLYMNVYGSLVNTRDEYAYQGADDNSTVFSGTLTNSTLEIKALNNTGGTTGTITLTSTIVY